MAEAGFFPLDLLGELISIGTLMAFAIVCAGIIILRRRMPEIERPFRTPWVPLIPVIGIGFSLWLMSNLPLITWTAFAIWLAVGVVVYFAYSRHASGLAELDFFDFAEAASSILRLKMR